MWLWLSNASTGAEQSQQQQQQSQQSPRELKHSSSIAACLRVLFRAAPGVVSGTC
jgi:hypothetical protein